MFDVKLNRIQNDLEKHFTPYIRRMNAGRSYCVNDITLQTWFDEQILIIKLNAKLHALNLIPSTTLLPKRAAVFI